MHDMRTTFGSSSTVAVMSPMLIGLPLLFILSNDNCKCSQLTRAIQSIEELSLQLIMGMDCCAGSRFKLLLGQWQAPVMLRADSCRI